MLHLRATLVHTILVTVSALLVSSDTCSNNRIPFGFEAHKNGHVNLLCSRPNCFDKKYAECDERPQRTSCEENNTWVGGLERTVDGKLYLQCCEYDPLAVYGEKLFDNVKVHVGEYFEGEEKTEEGGDWVIHFDLITNIKVIKEVEEKFGKIKEKLVYELTIYRFHCGRVADNDPAWRISPPWPWLKDGENENFIDGPPVEAAPEP